MGWKKALAPLTVLALFAAACGDGDDDAQDSSAPAPEADDAAPAGDTATSDAATADDTTADDTTADDTTADDTTADDTTADGVGAVDGDDSAAAGSDKVSVAILLPCAVNDLSWCQAAYEGVKLLETEGLIDVQIVDDAPFDAQGATRVMSGFANDGFDLVIGHSFDYGAPIHEMAPDFPDVKFAWHGSCGGFCGVEGPNITDYFMPMHEPAYLSGILGAGVSESGVIGANAGFDTPSCRSTLEAFLLGAREVLPEARRIDAFLGSWVDAALGKEASAAQAEQGADVFVACGNAGSIGMIQEVRERGLSAFGYVYDESSLAPENVLASMVWQIDETYRAMVNDIAAGDFQPTYDVRMKDGGFEVQINPGYAAAEVSPQAMELFETRKQEILDGTFEVPFIGSAQEG